MVAVHVVAADAAQQVWTRVLPSCGPACDAAAAARAHASPRAGAQVVRVPWRRDGSDWRPERPDQPPPLDPAMRAHCAAGPGWFHPVRCGHRPAHLARVLAGTAQGAAWTRWSCPHEEAGATPAADARLVDVVETPVAVWNPLLLRYDTALAARARHAAGS